MKYTQSGIIASQLLLTLTLAACGGGAGDPSTSTEPEVNAALPGTEQPDTSTPAMPAMTAISGRVADGYIQGATVCADINENESCDEGEPMAVTGEGGQYTLDLPSEADGKAIIANIPANAIDEDTGEAIGQDLLFIAPADKPEFISPITTLVHEELKNNPNLNVDEAESTVKSALGLGTSSDDVSLFTDYVANSRPIEGMDSDRADEFQYLHETARVVVGLMKDIRTNVETTAAEKGIDLTTDDATQQAVREIVRSEIKTLLPEIAKEVAVLIAENESEDGAVAAGGGRPLIDNTQIVSELFPEDRLENVDERIEQIRDRPDVEAADMKRILTDGMFWFDAYCEYLPYTPSDIDKGIPGDREPGVLTENGEHVVTGTEVDKYIDFEEPSAENCIARYSHVKLDAVGDNVVLEQFEFDKEQATWVTANSTEQERSFALTLVNGEWVPVSPVQPEGAVSFGDFGATINNENGSLKIQAAARGLDGLPVVHHLWESQSAPELLDSVDENTLFANGATAYGLGIEERSPAVVLFNFPADGLDADDPCLSYGDNCNVVQLFDEQIGTTPAISLDMMREASIAGVDFSASMYAGYGEEHMKVTLLADESSNQVLPESGTVQWHLPGEFFGGEYPVDHNMDTALEYDMCIAPDGTVYYLEEWLYNGPMNNPEGAVPMNRPEDADPLINPDGTVGDRDIIAPDPLIDVNLPFCPPGSDQPGVELPPAEKPVEFADAGIEPTVERPEKRNLLGEWRVIEIDGVNMIELEIPLAIRHERGIEEQKSLLLIEHEGFVRRGARFDESRIFHAIGYNGAAFDTLQPVLEAFQKNEHQAPLY